ncbi:MAG: hypothetical protein Q8O99_05540 [bacterium]|nr:hypothetical protein [bacterium]
MNRYLEVADTFHRKYGATGQQTPSLDFSEDFKEFRIQLMRSEFDEVCQDIRAGDTKNLAKEFADIMHGLCGTIVEFGCQHIFDEVVEEVFRSMTKDVVPDGRKALKGVSYTPASVDRFFT